MISKRTALLCGLLQACGSDSGIKTFNSDPRALITSHADGVEVEEGQVFTLRGTVSDSDDSPSDLMATWFVATEVLCDASPPDGDGATTCEAVLGQDETEIVLEVQDPMDATGSDRVSLTIISTEAPTALINAPDPVEYFYADRRITFSGQVSDTEDAAGDLAAQWSSDRDGQLALLSIPNAEGVFSDTGFLTEGSHEITLTATDSSGKRGTDQIRLVVGPANSNPTCAITSPEDDSSGPEGELVVFEGIVDDVDVPNSDLTIDWSSDKDGDLGTSTAESEGAISFAWGNLSAETHTISLTVTDEVGAACTDTILYTVGGPPEIAITAPDSGSIYNQGDRIELTGTIGDNEDLAHELDVVWDSDLDGELNTDRADSTGNLAFNTESLSIGTHTISLSVTDTDDMFSTASITIGINGLPTAALIDISPNPATTTDDLTVVIAEDGTDPEGSPLTYDYSWFVDGVASTESTTSILPASATTKNETWRVDVTSDDGTGTGETTSAERTISNTPPLLASVTLSPEAVRVEDDIDCVPGTTHDDDDDPVALQYQWTIEDTVSAITEATLPAAETASGQRIFCTVTPSDGTDDGEPVDSDRITIDNTAPTIETVSITPNPAYAGDDLLCSYTGYDDADDPSGDTDASTYRWTVNGVDAGTEQILSGDYIRADEITCVVTPSDGEAEGEPVSASLTISNTAPSVSAAQIAPEPATVSDTLVCTWTDFADPDGDADASTAAWTINGAAAGDGMTLAGGFTGGDVVGCTVTPSDGTDEGSTVSTDITIDNTGPELTSITIAPTTGIDTHTTLVCSATATDADGETPEITYSWTNGAEPLGTEATVTLTPETTSPGDTVTCTATATDEEMATDSDAASVTVDNSAPVMDDVSITPSGDVTTSTTLICSATATDADGDTPAITFVWTDHITGEALGSGSSLALSPDIAQPGDTIRCTATATDPEGDTDTGSDTVSVDNSSPELTSLTITPDSDITTSTTLTCEATATDPDGDTPTISYTWENTSSGTSLGAGESITLTPATSSPTDIIACTATATDAEADAVSDTYSVTIGNSDPVITGVSISPADGVETTTTLTCTAIATDADGDTPTLNYTWTNETTGETLGVENTIDLTPSISSPGDAIACTVIATDADGGTAVDADAIIVGNISPVISSVIISPDSDVDTRTSLICTIEATDGDGDTLTTEVTWTNLTEGTVLGTDDSIDLTTATTSPEDVIQCGATVTDPSGGADTAAATVTVINTDPVVESVSISPDSDVSTSETLTCSVSVSDDDGDTPTVTYQWTNDTQETSLGTDAEVTLTPETAAPDDRIRCAVVAADADGGSDSGESWLTIGNTRPEITGVSIVPSTDVRSYTTLTCTATATDEDGDVPTIDYIWSNEDSGDVLSTDNTVDLDPSFAQPGETIKCTATARDEFGGTDTDSDTVTVDNTAPVLTSVSISPDTDVDTSTTLTCSASATDDDDDEGASLTLSYAWTNVTQGTSLGTDASVVLTPTDGSPGDTIRCTATVTDGFDDTDSDAAEVIVDNTDPTVTAVSIEPDEDIDTSTTLTCSATSTDADGDTPSIAYVWTNTTLDSELSSEAEVVLTPTNSTPGDTIRCTATATDADGGIDSDSASITVDNTEPEIASIVVSPSAGVDTSTELTCSVSASDADGGTPEVSVVWTNETDDSTLGVETTLVLTSSTSSPGDEIACTATAVDAHGGTDSDSDSITVDNTDPEMGTVSISPDSGVDTSTTLICSATATDADGDTPTITYAWTNNTDETDLGSEATVTLSTSTSSPGDTITCTATATDADDGTDSGSAAVTVQNTQPELTGIEISPSTGVATSETLTCSATASDADGDTPSLSYAWTNSTTGSTLATSSELTLTPTTSSPGDTITCSATATDADGGTDSSSASIIVDNTNPTFTSVTITPSSDVDTSTSLTCSAVATDDDGDTPEVSYAWTNETEETALGTGPLVTLTATNSSPDDTIRCTANATDSDGGSATDSAQVTVDNTDPEIGTVTISPSTDIDTATELTCTATATDADGDTPTASYSWSNEDTGETLGTDDTLTLTASTAQPEQTITCTATATDADGGTDTDSASVTVDNTDPTVTSLSISPDSGVLTSSELTCTATAEDDDGDTPTIEYSWTNTTTGTTLSSEDTVTLTASTSSPGDEIACTATATDAHDGTASDTTSVTLDNTDPVVTDISISPDEDVVVGSTLTCSATATDDDGGTPTLTYRWTNATEDTSLGLDSTLLLTTSNSSPEDSIRCTATATDADGGTDTDATTVTVDNTDPVIASVSISPSSEVYSNTTLTCSVDASDADGDTPTASYTWANESTEETLGTDASLELDSSMVFPGQTVTCSVTVTDADSGTDSSSASVIVKNTPPSISVVAITPSSSVTTTTELTCSATASDVDDETPSLTYTWTNTTRGSALGATDTLALTTSTSAPGEIITCNATATDTEEASDFESASVTVENTNPEITSLSVSPDSDITTSTTLTCSATASDADGGEPDINYEWTNDTRGSTLATIHIVILTTTNSSPGDVITCKGIAKDDHEGTGTDTVSVTVDNSDPLISDMSIVPDDGVTTSTELVCSALALDPDGGATALTYTWTNLSEDTILSTETTLRLTTSTSSPEDNIECAVTATDSDGGSASSSRTVDVINQEPVIASISVSPDSDFYVGTEVTCSATATDDDDETLTPTYAWRNTTEETSLGSDATITLTTSNSSPGEILECTASVTDSYDDSDSDTISITVKNSNPDVSGVSISPASDVTTSTELSCSASASDDDGDTPTISYAWTNSTEGTTLGSSSDLTLTTSTTSPEDIIVCTATATDEDGGSGSDTDNVTLDNQKPTIVSLELDDTDYYTNDTITAEVVVTDADLDDVDINYAWVVDGSVVGASGKTLSGSSYFSKDQAVYVVATPNDGYDDGSSSTSDTVTILNTAPSTPSVSITLSDDELVCAIDEDSTDDDGDSISYTFEWSEDGTSYTDAETTSETGDTVPEDDVGYNNTWTCEVTPNDGDEDGSTDTASYDNEVERGCGSLDFDGDDWVEVTGSLDIYDKVTLEMWIKPDSWEEDVPAWIGDWYFQLCTSSKAGIAVQQYIDGDCDDLWKQGKWNYLVAAWNHSTDSRSVWINGQPVSTTRAGASLTDRGVIIGALDTSGSDGFDGKISEMRLWNKILSDDEVEEYWETSPDTTADGLVAEWEFYDGSGTTIGDITGNGYTGTINGAEWSEACAHGDVDGDGYETYEDCDDEDSSLTTDCGSRYWRISQTEETTSHAPRTGEMRFWSNGDEISMTADMMTTSGSCKYSSCSSIDTPLPYGYSNNCSDTGWIWSDGSALTIDFGSKTLLNGLDFYHVYGGGTRGATWNVERSSDGSDWVTEASLTYESSSCGWSEFSW